MLRGAQAAGTRQRVVVLLFVLLQAAHPAAEDWNFTPADFDTLTSGGGNLDLHGDSAWVPPAVRDNLLKTLRKILDPKLNPPSTEGVNVRDLYHAHIACPRPCPEELLAARSALRKADEADEGAALGGEWFDPVTAGNLEQFVEAKRRSELRTRDLLAKYLREDCVLIYHTYETNAPRGMQNGDPRRNIRTPHGGDPRGFTPPDPKDSSSYLDDYCELAQIAFLIDETGKVHVTTGTTHDLSKVVGSPLR